MADKDSGGGEGRPEAGGGGSGGGGAISEQERDWAQTALADFNRGHFSACLQLLARLEAARPHDTKVLHNRAVVEYYKSDLRKTDHFKKNMNAVCAQAHINIDDLDSLEDVEHCVIYYNQAVVLYHLKQYSSALKIMNKVFSFIEPMEESLAHRVCLLLIELHLCTQQPDKALALITYVENQFVSTENAASKMMAAATADKDKDKEKEVAGPPPPPAFVAVDAATDAFRLKLLQCRARCFLATCALTACQRELRSIIDHASSAASAAPRFLTANLHYLRGNFAQAIATLGSVPLDNSLQVFKETGESPSVAYYNDMGCLHHYLAKPNLANFYLSKAVAENKAAVASFAAPAAASDNLSGRPLHTVGGSRQPQLMYNLGVSLLHAGKPLLAFDCLTEAVQVYHMNPRLWLRLAECCIMSQRPDNSVDFDFQTKRKQLIQGVVGSGQHRKIILNPLVFSNSHYSYEAQSFAIPVASLEFASLCLRNAQLLVPATGADDRPLPTPPSPPCDPRHIPHLRAAILAASAYVALGLGDPVLALEHANALLAAAPSPVHKFLGHVYAGEALVLLDRIPEAIDQLNPELCPDITGDWHKPLRAWYPQSTDTARSVLQYNMAVALAISGEYEKAGDLLKQVWLLRAKNNVPIHVIALAMYVELLLGHADVARTIVKQNCMVNQR
ncbi:hypothetical protein LSTR_LSTR007271 [Laodelphax striatellus]|uniref:CCR4-NOT transcription complex subunit 10 n=1 Tax=Laodelphax striatellus TaxID=195883 RepID=A0A482XEU5_LAOST|nr:hypothetical protein LSTR_LSTR007271 [Laodelphax striatellus]